MKCPICSEELEEDALQCSNCGTVFEVDDNYNDDAIFIKTVDPDAGEDIALPFDDDDDDDDYISPFKEEKEPMQTFAQPEQNNVEIKTKEIMAKTATEIIAEIKEESPLPILENGYRDLGNVDNKNEDVANDEPITYNDLAKIEDNKQEQHELNENDTIAHEEDKTNIDNGDTISTMLDFDENDDFDDTAFSKEEMASGTYLDLNFKTEEKFVALVSSDMPIIDDNNRASGEENDFVSSGPILEEIDKNLIVSVDQLSLKLADTAIMREERKKNELRETKEIKLLEFKKRKVTFLRVIIASILACLVIANFFMLYFLSFNKTIKINSELYTKSMFEQYDNLIWSDILSIENQNSTLFSELKQYNEGTVNLDSIKKSCEDHINAVTSYSDLFSKPVYVEAKDYLFEANKLAFSSSFIAENMLDYFSTGDEKYKDNAIASISEEETNRVNILESRKDFLKKIGYSDAEIAEILKKNDGTLATKSKTDLTKK